MALASQKDTKPLIVEYVSTAVNGEGRLYARHSSVQQLPRLVRTIFYGNTHKEIDISEAHYKLIRLEAKSNFMPIGPLRETLSCSFKRNHQELDQALGRGACSCQKLCHRDFISTASI